jgi:RNA polymerase sigma-70 factor (sigma-E family)
LDAKVQERFADWTSSRLRPLHRFAFLLCGDWHLAEDLVQDSLVKAARHWRRIEGSDNPDAYVRRIVINQLRSLQRRPSWRLRAQHPVDPTPVADNTELHAVRAEILAALRQLPPRQRAVIVLRYYEQLSEAETAAVLGCTTGTVKSQTHRGLQAMRRTMAVETAHVD